MKTVKGHSDRLMSIDAFRGFDMFMIIGVDADTAHKDAFRTVRAWDIAEPTASDHRPVAIILEDR